MRLFVALRLLSEQHAKPTVEASNQTDFSKSTLVDANVARLHPALKNICSYLIAAGVLPEKRRGQVRSCSGDRHIEREADFRLYWCEIETDLTADEWYSKNDVEAVIPKDEFSKFTASIRHKSGATYVVACETYAQALRINQAGHENSEVPYKSAGRAA